MWFSTKARCQSSPHYVAVLREVFHERVYRMCSAPPRRPAAVRIQCTLGLPGRTTTSTR